MFPPAPIVQVTLTINSGTGQTVIVPYSPIPLPQIPGYVQATSQSGGGLTGATVQFGLPTTLVNGSVTVSVTMINGFDPNTLVRFRTDAAEQQGQVSYLDLPYDFTTVGGTSVSKLNLGGQALGPALPNIAGTPPKTP